MTQIRTWENVDQVLEDLHSAQGRLAGLYGELTERAPDDRTRLLLELLAERARKSEEEYGSYRREISDKILHTWIQFRPREGFSEMVEELRGPDAPSIDSLTRVGLRVARYHEELFDGLADFADSQGALELKELFGNLKERAQRSQRMHATRIQSVLEM